MTPWVFALLALAAYRSWQLLANDSILERPRSHLPESVREFLECPFCAGFWTAAAWWGAWEMWPHATVVVAVPFALSAALVFLSVSANALTNE